MVATVVGGEKRTRGIVMYTFLRLTGGESSLLGNARPKEQWLTVVYSVNEETESGDQLQYDTGLSPTFSTYQCTKKVIVA